MEILFLLVPLGAGLALAIVALLVWAVQSGQFDDLESPALAVLSDESSNVIDRGPQPSLDGDQNRLALNRDTARNEQQSMGARQ